MGTKAKNSAVRNFLHVGLSWAQASELAKSPYVELKNAGGYIVPAHQAANAATWSQSGTVVTVTSTAHTIPATTYDGYKVYFSSATTTGMPLAAGLYENFTRTGTGTYTFTVPATLSQTATGTATTNTTETVIPDLTSAMPANTMGATSKLKYTVASSNNNNGGTKTVKLYVSTAVLGTITTTTAIFGNMATDYWFNRNSLAKNVVQSTGASTTIDMGAAQDITVSVTNSAADQFVAVDSVIVELLV